jgi:hypothetical protein
MSLLGRSHVRCDATDPTKTQEATEETRARPSERPPAPQGRGVNGQMTRMNGGVANQTEAR